MPSSGCDFWLCLSLVNILMAPVLGLRNGLAGLGDRIRLKCVCMTWKQLEVEAFGKGDIVCSVFAQYLAPQGLNPLLELLETPFGLKAANLTSRTSSPLGTH